MEKTFSNPVTQLVWEHIVEDYKIDSNLFDKRHVEIIEQYVSDRLTPQLELHRNDSFELYKLEIYDLLYEEAYHMLII